MNVIILTTGISGSSVMTGFLAKAGFWTGDETVYKDNSTGNYETYENRALVELNEDLIKKSGLNYDSKARYDSALRDDFDALSQKINPSAFTNFINKCDSHSPWIWKDPRLIITIGFWKNLIDLENTQFIVIYRNSYELWKSQASKRIIFDYGYLTQIEEDTRNDLFGYLKSHNLSYLPVEYDSITSKPEPEIRKLNAFLKADLTIEDWNTIYRSTNKIDNFKRTAFAFLIYVKNYSSRIR
ncbi:MAG: hypothetical protein ACI9YE_001165 [Psychroserpens sp.]|jgi:hypothetical protein